MTPHNLIGNPQAAPPPPLPKPSRNSRSSKTPAGDCFLLPEAETPALRGQEEAVAGRRSRHGPGGRAHRPLRARAGRTWGVWGRPVTRGLSPGGRNTASRGSSLGGGGSVLPPPACPRLQHLAGGQQPEASDGTTDLGHPRSASSGVHPGGCSPTASVTRVTACPYLEAH